MLSATIISPGDASFEVVDAQPPDDGVNQKNPNTRILLVNATVPASGDLDLKIQLATGDSPAR